MRLGWAQWGQRHGVGYLVVEEAEHPVEQVRGVQFEDLFDSLFDNGEEVFLAALHDVDRAEIQFGVVADIGGLAQEAFSVFLLFLVAEEGGELFQAALGGGGHLLGHGDTLLDFELVLEAE